MLSLLLLVNGKRRQGDGSSVPKRSVGRRGDDRTVPVAERARPVVKGSLILWKWSD